MPSDSANGPRPGAGDHHGDPGYRQLHMLWPAGRRPYPDALRPAPGYLLRPGSDADIAPFRELMARVELGSWGDEELAQVHASVLPDGWLVVVHQPTGRLVATGMAQHNPVPELYPGGYEVGWIAADPDHSGHGLGRSVTAAVANRLVDAGAMSIFLRTDDFRLPALAIYLRLGFTPHLYAPDMSDRWAAVHQRLGGTPAPSAGTRPDPPTARPLP
ncbi:GNAT family N-acetyltransferase [Rugosimonospora africana]|uniref:GNAT family N-acetyltransferase n=1 Tax=Rugosimonospora africana TaxID=556532 RepID=UPI0019437F7A|nr:GNAT family N-acetyltransferase [Rugosimonospora africana]